MGRCYVLPLHESNQKNVHVCVFLGNGSDVWRVKQSSLNNEGITTFLNLKEFASQTETLCYCSQGKTHNYIIGDHYQIVISVEYLHAVCGL